MVPSPPAVITGCSRDAGLARWIIVALLLICGSGLAGAARSRLLLTQESPEHPPLYLPDTRYVRLITGGYDTVASRVIWFQTINYFGKQFAAGKDYRWLKQMCSLVIDLDPKAVDAAAFCGTLLPWIAHEPEAGVSILSRAIDANPSLWRLLYLRGFTEWYFLENPGGATADILRASRLPDAPAFLLTLSSRLVANESGAKLARQFLEETLANTTDPIVTKALRRKLKRARLSEALEMIRDASGAFLRDHGRPPATPEELITTGYLTSLPVDPYNGTFFINPQSGEVGTTSGKAGIEFRGKSSKTGLYAREFEQQRPGGDE